MSTAAVTASKKKGFLHGPYRATTVGASLVNGRTITKCVCSQYLALYLYLSFPRQHLLTYVLLSSLSSSLYFYPSTCVCSQPIQFHTGESLDSRMEAAMTEIYEEVKATAKEFNTRGDLNSGTNIAAFLRIANVMLSHGSV